MNRNTKMLSLRNINFERRMNRGSLNAALKKGVSTDTISNRQVLCANELNRKRRDEMIQKKRGVEMMGKLHFSRGSRLRVPAINEERDRLFLIDRVYNPFQFHFTIVG
jgi:hypothetical protein